MAGKESRRQKRSFVAVDTEAGQSSTIGTKATADAGTVMNAVSRLDYLDGVRAIAALFVVLHHTWLFSTVQYPIHAQEGFSGFATNWMLYGHLSVDVFIVLSGFCLILPVARTGKLTGGALRFYGKRVRRILPPYFAALLLSLALRITTDTLAHQGNFPISDIWANLFLVQDIFTPSIAAFNAPLWSVAVESKIYLFFPLIVLLLRIKKYGVMAVLLLTAAIGYGIVDLVLLLAPKLPISELSHSCPWYLFLFGMGVVSGAASTQTAAVLKRSRWWQGGALGAFLLLSMLLYLFPWRLQEAELSRQFPLIDAVTGGLTAALLVLWGNKESIMGRFLASTWLVRIGTFAYSIYLIHYPLLQVLESAVVKPLVGDTNQMLRFGFLLLIGLPLVLISAYGFFLVAERPFMRRGRAETEAVLSPAP